MSWLLAIGLWLVATVLLDAQHLDGLALWSAALLAAGGVVVARLSFPLLDWLGPKRHLGRWGAVVVLFLVVLLSVNIGEGDDVVLPEHLFMLGAASVVLLLASRLAPVAAALRAGFWVGGLYLLLSGALLVVLTPSALYFDTKALHALLGYGWAALFFVYVVRHAAKYNSQSRDRIRSAGYAGAVLLTVSVLAGAGHLFLASDTWSTHTALHVFPALFGLAAVIVHLKRLVTFWPPRWNEPISSRQWIGLGLTGVMAIAVLAFPVLSGPPPEEHGGSFAWSEAEIDAHLANPRTGLTATSTDGSGIPASLLGVHRDNGSCGGGGGCHATIEAQWDQSAHRFAANPAYQYVVSRLVAEEGVAAARLCAGCHDPVALLSGAMTAEAPYPSPESEGVTCRVCHGLELAQRSESPGSGHGNGVYRVRAQPNEQHSRRYPIVPYMMVRDEGFDHRQAWNREGFTNSTTCAPCHNLTLGHVSLRFTFDDWANSQNNSQNNGRTCADCHMPAERAEELGGSTIHNHRFPASNLGIAPLFGGDPADSRRFIASAVGLWVRDHGQTAELVLQNFAGGHGFPAAPRDMVAYWFEVRRGDGAWARVGPDSLFHQTLYDADGEVIEGHRIWAAVRAEGPEMLAPGEHRTWTVSLPSTIQTGGTLEARLMHVRFAEPELRQAMKAAGMFAEPLEIRRSSSTPN